MLGREKGNILWNRGITLYCFAWQDVTQSEKGHSLNMMQSYKELNSGDSQTCHWFKTHWSKLWGIYQVRSITVLQRGHMICLVYPRHRISQPSVSVQGWHFTVIANRVTSKPNLRIHLLFFPYDYNTLRLFRRRSKKPTYRFCSERWKWVVCMPISAHAQWKYLHFFVTENVQSFTLGTKCQGMVGVQSFTFYIDLWFISYGQKTAVSD